MSEKTNTGSEAGDHAFASVFQVHSELHYRARIADAIGDAGGASEYRAYARMLDALLVDMEACNQRGDDAPPRPAAA